MTSFSTPWYRRPDGVRHAVYVAIYVVLRYALGLVAQWFDPTGRAGSLLYLPVGLDVGLLMALGARYAWAVLLAQYASVALNLPAFGVSAYALMSPVILTGVYTGAVLLLRYHYRVSPALHRLRDVLLFVSVLVLGAAFVESLAQNTTAVMTERILPSAFFERLMRFWAGDAAGIIALTPLVLVLARYDSALWWSSPALTGLRWPRPRAQVRTLLFYAALVAGSVLLVLSLPGRTHLNYTGLLFVPVLWAAIRLDFKQTTLVLFVVNMAMALLVGPRLRPETEFALQFALLIVSVGGLVVAAYVSDRKRMLQRLSRAMHRAEAGARFKSRLVQHLSHEVRTPLTSILGFAEILEDELPEESREPAQLIQLSGHRLLNTLQTVLHYSALETDQRRATVVSYDLRQVAQSACRAMHPFAESRDLTLRAAVGATPVPAALSPDLLDFVLRQVLDNAIKFTLRGEVEVRVFAEDGYGVVEVCDTGVGMSDAFLNRLFIPFEQQSQGLTREFEGLGLGLVVVRQLLRLMNGTLDIASEVDQGTCVTIRLPGAPAASPDAVLERAENA